VKRVCFIRPGPSRCRQPLPSAPFWTRLKFPTARSSVLFSDSAVVVLQQMKTCQLTPATVECGECVLSSTVPDPLPALAKMTIHFSFNCHLLHSVTLKFHIVGCCDPMDLMPQADIVADPHVQQRGMIETVASASPSDSAYCLKPLKSHGSICNLLKVLTSL
jgi:hypothetical protein